MLKSVLASLLVYFLSFFKCPKSFVHRIEKIQRDFLWNDIYNHKKIPLGEMGCCL